MNRLSWRNETRHARNNFSQSLLDRDAAYSIRQFSETSKLIKWSRNFWNSSKSTPSVSRSWNVRKLSQPPQGQIIEHRGCRCRKKRETLVKQLFQRDMYMQIGCSIFRWSNPVFHIALTLGRFNTRQKQICHEKWFVQSARSF